LRLGDGVREFLIQSGSHVSCIILHGGNRRPVGGLIAGEASTHGVDAEGKEAVEVGMKGLQSKHALVEQIPIEGLQMPDVENDAVTLGDRPLVQRIRLNDTEELIALIARARELLEQIVSDGGVGLRGKHSNLSIQWRDRTKQRSGLAQVGKSYGFGRASTIL
jgi:hypothetical protein